MVRPGVAANYSVSVSNQDASGCNTTTFGLVYTGGSVSGLVSPASLTLAAGQSGSGALSANSNLADGSYSLAVSVTDTDGVAPNHSAATQATATLVVDSMAPSVPSGLKGVVDRQGRISLSWLAATDALSGIAAYTVYRNGAAIAQVATGTTYIDSTATSGSSYQYTVSARDAAGNVSAASTAITATAGSGKTTGKK